MRTYTLHIASTGELIKRQETPYTLVVWQKRVEQKLLKYKRTPEHIINAIKSRDTIAGWSSYDSFVAKSSDKEIEIEIYNVFREYESYYDKYFDKKQVEYAPLLPKRRTRVLV